MVLSKQWWACSKPANFDQTQKCLTSVNHRAAQVTDEPLMLYTFPASAAHVAGHLFQWKVLARVFSGWYPNSSRKPYNCHFTPITKKTKHAAFKRRVSRTLSLLNYCNQVSCREDKAFNEMLEREEGTFQTPQRHKGQHWDWDRGEKDGEAKFQRCFTERKLRLVSFFDAQNASLPRTLTHTCVRAGHSTQCRKKSSRTARSSRSSALFPQCSLSPDPWSKFVYVCGVTLQVTSKTPTQRTLLHYISSIKAVRTSFHSC